VLTRYGQVVIKAVSGGAIRGLHLRSDNPVNENIGRHAASPSAYWPTISILPIRAIATVMSHCDPENTRLPTSVEAMFLRTVASPKPKLAAGSQR